jgi:hypothetical protein
LGAPQPAARAIAPVLLGLAEKWAPQDEVSEIQISYASIARYSGIASHNAIHRALVALDESGFIKLPKGGSNRFPARDTACYKLTPHSDALWELSQAMADQNKQEIAAEIELRARQRKERILKWSGT